ncbi:hypothetical protein K378_01468 [Streptomyces sp. Amel2xB2]|uniref:hypothetical protein n=1 Tax=Streptomyces sp. Amel2xB2 TaxID=1305829 RepID=UPI000DBA48CE|nr:hypothetical protein [Streptomyces sp. Amel2xB2]RAJ70303.1 hypothetical protein K378_01468 [Streptomyces sp. Amel2xB2]
MPRELRRLAHLVGRRGATLLLLGGLVTLYGVGQLAKPIPNKSGIRLLLMVMDLDCWSWTWIGAGLLAIFCAFLRPGRDWPGFTGLWLATVPWALSFFVSWWPLYDNPRGWISAAIFAAFGTLPLVLVGWDEPARRESPESP